MSARKITSLQAVFLGLGLLILSPAANSTAASKASDPSLSASLQHASKHGSASPAGQPKPLAVWQCTSSWYGEDFDGLPTATGETYDMYASTAAHPTLPLGSIVRVVNPRNHRSEVVRINDRGPYVGGRELDVSYAVARRLGFDQRGFAKVRLELLQVPSHPVAEHHENN
jgi:rare lipoprotein A (peptidoglycan hydrolase)